MYEVTLKSGRAKTQPMVYKNIWEVASLMESVLSHSTDSSLQFVVNVPDMEMTEEEFEELTLLEVKEDEDETV